MPSRHGLPERLAKYVVGLAALLLLIQLMLFSIHQFSSHGLENWGYWTLYAMAAFMMLPYYLAEVVFGPYEVVQTLLGWPHWVLAVGGLLLSAVLRLGSKWALIVRERSTFLVLISLFFAVTHVAAIALFSLLLGGV